MKTSGEVSIKLRIRQILRDEPVFVEVAKTGAIAQGKMKSVEVKGVDVLIANVGGKFYALDDRCGHMNALLSMGTLRGKIVVCPFHFAEFDVTTGQKIKDPRSESFENLDKLPGDMQKFLIYAKKLVDPVKTYDMQTHEVKVKGDRIFIRI
jgi:nitrite reductase/ring-hydroxylating ferredoxin subunit